MELKLGPGAEPGSRLEDMNMAKAALLDLSEMERREGVGGEAEKAGFTFLAEYDQHPSMRRLLEEGHEVIVF
jgi:hypothetical protein